MMEGRVERPKRETTEGTSNMIIKMEGIGQHNKVDKERTQRGRSLGPGTRERK